MSSWGNPTNRNGRNGNISDEMLDQQNTEMTTNLASKVSHLKSIAFDMQKETEESNSYINGMGEDFEGTQGLLSGSVKRIGHMVNAGKTNRKMMCYIVLGLVAVFVISFYFISRYAS